MKKLLFSLAMLLTTVGAWAQEYSGTEIVLTTDEDNPTTYVLEPNRPGYVWPDLYFDGEYVRMNQHNDFSSNTTTIEKYRFLFYFTEADADGGFYIHPYAAEKGNVLGVPTNGIQNNAALILVNKTTPGDNTPIVWTKVTATEGSNTRPCFKTTLNETDYYLFDGDAAPSIVKITTSGPSFRGHSFNLGQQTPALTTLKEEMANFDNKLKYYCRGDNEGQFAHPDNTYENAYKAAEDAVNNNKKNSYNILSDFQTAKGGTATYKELSPDKYYIFKNKKHNQYMNCTGRRANLSLSNDNMLILKYTTDSNKKALQIYKDAETRYVNGLIWANYAGYSTDTKFYQLSDAPGSYIIYDNTNSKIYQASAAGGNLSYIDDRSAAFTNEGCHWMVEEIPLSVEITDAGAATLYSPIALNIPSDVTAKYVKAEGNDAEDGTLVYTSLENVIPANTAVVLIGAENNYTFTPATEASETVTDNILFGYSADKTVSESDHLSTGPNGKVFALAVKTNGLGFYPFVGDTYKAGKAYLDITSLPAALQARFFNIFEEGEETAIESIEGAENADAVVYDLAGRRVKGTQKGLYIVNGKVVIK